MTMKARILLSMLGFVPVSIIAEWLHLHPLAIFIASGLAIIPLAAWIANSTEAIATVVGPSFGGLLNATFGNATEMIISIVALHAGLIDVVKASLTGSLIANLLLALGLAMLLGGLRFSEQSFQPTVARINASSLTLAVIVLIAPTAIQVTSKGLQTATLNNFSYATAILLLTFYGLMLVFSMKTHRDIFLFEEVESDLTEPNKQKTEFRTQIGVLLVCTVVLVFISNILVESLEIEVVV